MLFAVLAMNNGT